MKKEVFLAITIGFALGLIITFGIWTANKSLKQLPQPTPSTSPIPSSLPTPTPSPTTNNEQTNKLTISTPEDEALVTSNNLTLSGTAMPNATVAITSETGEKVITADSSGKFTTQVTLESGFNTINIIAYDTAGNSSSQSLTITYTTAKV